MKIPSHEATTAQLGAAYPFVSSSRMPGDRVVIGRDLYGATFSYDPFDLYTRGFITNPNMVVLGQVGRGKSALVKSYLFRQFAFGRRIIVIDPKGEYGPFAEVVGGEVLRLVPGGSMAFNPLGLADTKLHAVELLALRQSILAGICSASLGRRLGVDESVALQVAMQAWHDASVVGRRQVTLREVVARLFNPREEDARSLYQTRDRLIEMGRIPGFALMRLLAGEFGAMFDGAGTDGLDFGADVLVLDVSAFYRSDALSVLLVCLFGALQQIVQLHDAPTICVVDEAWAVLANPFAAMFLQSFFKLARSFGVANLLVAHRPSDLLSSDLLGVGRDATKQVGSGTELSHVQGLLADCETVVSYALSPRETELAQRLFGVNDRQGELLSGLGRGVALWRVARRSLLVRHQLTSMEMGFVDTDARMRL